MDVGEHTYVEGKVSSQTFSRMSSCAVHRLRAEKSDTHLLVQDAEQFNWLKQWYPVQATQNLDPKKPFGTKLLGVLHPPHSSSVRSPSRNLSALSGFFSDNKQLSASCPGRAAGCRQASSGVA